MRVFGGTISSFLLIKVFFTTLLLSVSHERFIDERNLDASSEDPHLELTIDEMISLATLENKHANGPDDVDDIEMREFDMILTRDQYEALHPGTTGHRQKRKAKNVLAHRWTDNQVWYRRQLEVFSENQWNKILDAMRVFEEQTCLTFHEDVDYSHNNHVYIVTGQGCSSYVGMVGGARKMTLGNPYCFVHGVLLHEIGHAIGFFHEHTRPDRDDYIEILTDNIIPEWVPYFDKEPPHGVNHYNVPFDYNSVMHYGGKAASVNGDFTIRTKDRSKQSLIGQRRWLSFHDIMLANRMYECDVKCDQTVKCPPNTYRGKDCLCYCEVNSRPQLCTGTTPTPPVTRTPVTKASMCDDLNGACTFWVTSLPNLCSNNPDVIKLCPKSCNRCKATSAETTIMAPTSKSTTTSIHTSTSTSTSTPARISTTTSTSTPARLSTSTSTSTEPITSTPTSTIKPCRDQTNYTRVCVHWARVPGLCQRDFNVRQLCKKSCGGCHS